MYKLSSTIVIILLFINGFGQSPHGNGFKIDCSSCHTSESWKVLLSEIHFDHNSTKFKLTGQHQRVDCKLCHQTLKFGKAKGECFQCHTDMHQNTLGTDCARCHDTRSWIVTNAITLHQLSRFPLLGNHAVADCASCHKSASGFKYEPLSVECVSCHRADYLATTTPSHVQSGYSTNCTECHGTRSRGWNDAEFEHGFFPLSGGHRIGCADCHTEGTYQKISNECISCHLNNYNLTSNPNHQQAGFSNSCTECHTTNPGWNPAEFRQHDSDYFPIYSGKHKGEWTRCNDCHTTNSYASFSCIICHEHSNKSSVDSDHRDENGYVYNGTSCYTCHPKGDN